MKRKPLSSLRADQEGSVSVSVSGQLNGVAAQWLLPAEAPIAILLNSQSYAVMMATPADIEDFALGFVLSEGLAAHHSHVKNAIVLKQAEGLSVDVSGTFVSTQMKPRAMEGRVGCGLCGVAELADALRMPSTKVPRVTVSPAAFAKGLAALPRHQPMNEANHSTHGAAFCSVDGTLLLAREDVGRHNALDKLIGAMARSGVTPEHGFAVISSRCSSELVQKCARVGIGALATVSAPTSLALELAQRCGMMLAARARDGVMIFNGD